MFWASPSGDKREYLLRDEINYMFAKNQSDPMFHNKINENQLAIMGHSTGGWGALTLATSALPGLVEVAVKIKAVSLIAPAVPGDQWPLAGQISPRPLIVLDGTEDISIDGADGDPIAIFDNALPPKIYVKITGANHFGYTDSLTDLNDGTPGQTLPREEQQTIAEGYLTAFFTRFLTNKLAEEAYLRGQPIETLEGYAISVKSNF
jgi:predicted dienelactone hydrolase